MDSIEAVAVMLGYDLMPWQREWFAVTSEYRVRTGEFYYPTCVSTVPRQAGKSVMAKVLCTWRCMKWPDQTVLYIAQTRGHAAKHVESLAKDLRRAGVEGFKYTRGVGQEQIRFDNGSTIYVESPNASGGHGASTSTVVIDEAFTLEPYTAQGIIPTLLAEATSQLWIISTQGTEDSLAWNGFVERGRESVKVRNADIAYLEYSADIVAGDDVLNREHWARWMPSLNITVTERSMQLAIENTLTAEGPLGVLRAYGNVLTATESELWPAEWLERSLDPYAVRPATGLVFAFDANVDPAGSAITACWKRDDGRWHVAVVKHGGGDMKWIVPEMQALIRKYRPVSVITPGGGPARAVSDQVKAVCEQFVIPFVALAVNDMAASHMLFYDALRTETLMHDGDESLVVAMQRVRVRDAADQWRFDRKASRVNLSPLFAAAAGLKAAQDMDGRKREFAIF